MHVSFCNSKPTVHVMYTWQYAYKAARCGKWEQIARDNARFKMRIQNISTIINPVLLKKYQQYIKNK